MLIDSDFCFCSIFSFHFVRVLCYSISILLVVLVVLVVSDMILVVLIVSYMILVVLIVLDLILVVLLFVFLYLFNFEYQFASSIAETRSYVFFKRLCFASHVAQHATQMRLLGSQLRRMLSHVRRR